MTKYDAEMIGEHDGSRQWRITVPGENGAEARTFVVVTISDDQLDKLVALTLNPPAYEPPPPPPVTVSAAVFFERTTAEEADKIDAAMNAKGTKIRRAWQAANSFTEGSDLWTALIETIVALFGEPRATELLTA